MTQFGSSVSPRGKGSYRTRIFNQIPPNYAEVERGHTSPLSLLRLPPGTLSTDLTRRIQACGLSVCCATLVKPVEDLAFRKGEEHSITECRAADTHRPPGRWRGNL
jgi:hypothetical protein